MPKRTYEGGQAAVLLRLAEGSYCSVKNGETVDVTADVAAELSDDWSKTQSKDNGKQDNKEAIADAG